MFVVLSSEVEHYRAGGLEVKQGALQWGRFPSLRSPFQTLEYGLDARSTFWWSFPTQLQHLPYIVCEEHPLPPLRSLWAFTHNDLPDDDQDLD